MPESFSDGLKIRRLKQLGSGGQANVFLCQLQAKSKTIVCVDKLRRVYNNLEMSEQVFKDMYREFSIGCTLNHPGIVEYKYFVRQSASRTKDEEFHIFIELMDGGNLEEYLARMPLKREVSI